jgi:hypothetical protein
MLSRVCVCVCVCVEREREKEGGKNSECFIAHFAPCIKITICDSGTHTIFLKVLKAQFLVYQVT